MKGKFDFSGWATKNDLKCSDGRVIRRDAFKVNDGMTVPLVWNHRHDTTSAVLGHALLENRDEGVYAYGFLNNTRAGKEAKEMISHGDVVSLSIYANNLVQDGANVLHGAIREVSLVLAGANPGAFIESAFAHGEPIDDADEEGVIYAGGDLSFYHSDIKKKKDDEEDEDDEEYDEDEEESEDEAEDEDEEDEEEEEPVVKKKKKGEKEMAHSADSAEKGGEKTIQDIVDTMNDEQKDAMYALIGAAVEDAQGGSDEDEEEDMKHNVFDSDVQMNNYIAHAAILDGMLDDAKKKKVGSLKELVDEAYEEGVLEHSIDTTGMDVGTGDWRSIIPEGRPTTYGFNDPDMLFPDPKSLNNPPEWIQRNMDWVSVVLNGVHRSPFSRIKSQFANITEDEARAKGYTKTHKKTEEMFSVLKRVTTPTTIYKKQRMDRDDIIDITDFDVVAWIKGEMRIMLNEEIARAILVGDGRQANSPDKIDESSIRPIIKDDPLFNTKVAVSVAHGASGETKAKAAIDAVIRARKNYKGSGNPILFTTEDWVTEMLLIKDQMGHYLYETEATLATRLRVSRIVTVEILENQTVPVTTTEGGSTVTENKPLLGVIVNPVDYNVGADKGGSIELFDDFDIDFNQYVWLMEGRMSGALTKPFSALTVYVDEAAAG